MLPQEALKKEARELLSNRWEFEDRLRDNEALRAYMVPLIVEVGDLIRRHAARMGEHTGFDCAFQIDFFAELLIWQLTEFLCQADFGNDMRLVNTNIYQLDEHHAADWFSWPPAPEAEPESEGS